MWNKKKYNILENQNKSRIQFRWNELINFKRKYGPCLKPKMNTFEDDFFFSYGKKKKGSNELVNLKQYIHKKDFFFLISFWERFEKNKKSELGFFFFFGCLSFEIKKPHAWWEKYIFFIFYFLKKILTWKFNQI